MKIFWTPLAADKLDKIYEFIAGDNISAANKMVNRIIKKVDSLSINPQRGRMVPEVNRKEVREIFEGEYRIIYRIENDKVYILSIRNFKQLLPPKDFK